MGKAVFGIRGKLFLSGFVVIVVILGTMSVIVTSILKKDISAEIEAFRIAEVERVKNELRSNVSIACALLEEARNDYSSGRMSLEEAKQHALEGLQHLRYNSGTGYFWVNDDGDAPRMIMHPTMPDLNGTVLSGPRYNCTKGEKKNLYMAMVDACRKKGEGFVDYLWPKAYAGTVTEDQPMLSYVKMYKPFGWIIGTERSLDEINSIVSERSIHLEQEVKSLVMKIAGMTVGFLFLAFFPLMLVSRTIVDPIRECIRFAREVGSGNLAASIHYESNDETGMLAKELNSMVSSVRTLLMDVRQQAAVFHNASGHLARYSSNMSDSSDNVSEQSTSVVAAAEQISMNVSAISETIDSISLGAAKISGNTKAMSENVSSVARSIDEISVSVREVASHCGDAERSSSKALTMTDESCEKVAELNAAAENVGQVIELITSITEQTKLLALNATIEAARAGQAGQGFSVVAGEVRELANQAARATEDISYRVKEIQQQTAGVVKLIQEIAILNQDLNEINSSIAIASEQQAASTHYIAGIIAETAKGSESVSNEVDGLTKSIEDDIARSAREASHGVHELSENIKLVNLGVKEGASAAAGNFVFSKDMTRVSTELKRSLKRFNIGQSNFNIGKVKAAHLAWRTHLEAMLHRGMDLRIEDIPNHTQCEFGKWIASPEGQALKTHEAFPEMFELHDQVHILATRIAEHYHEGRQAEAMSLMEDFEKTRKDLFAALDKMYTVG